MPDEMRRLRADVAKRGTWNISEMNLKFLANLEFWYGLSIIGNVVMLAALARTGNQEGYIPVAYESVWFMLGAAFTGILATVRTLDKKHRAKEKGMDAGFD